MTHPAALQADYRIIKPVAGRSCYILQLEVPWEAFDEVNRVLGAPPKPGENRWVGLALLNPDIAKPIMETGIVHHKLPPVTTKTVAKGQYGDYAAKLYKSGFFLSEAVCESLGTDEEYRKWIQGCASCISNKYNYTELGPKCEAAHVRRAGQSGTGYKAPYSCIPLTHEEHQLQHQKGESALLLSAGIAFDDAKEWFNKKRCHYVQEWGKMRLKERFKAESLADIEPNIIRMWALECNLTKYLPQELTKKE